MEKALFETTFRNKLSKPKTCEEAVEIVKKDHRDNLGQILQIGRPQVFITTEENKEFFEKYFNGEL